MINTNYGQLIDGYPQYLRLPIQLTESIAIGEVTHPAGAYLSTNDDAAIKEMGYKPVTRTAMPTREGYYHWWECSPYFGNGNSFCLVTMNGAATFSNPTLKPLIAFAFCV